MTATTAPAFVLALRDQLRSRFAASQDFTAVDVLEVEPQGDLPHADRVVLVRGKVPAEYRFVHPNRSRDESVSIPGYLYAFASDPGPDAATAAWRAAWERAADILAEIMQEVDENIAAVDGGILKTVLVSSVEYQPSVEVDGGWGCMTLFTVSYITRIEPGGA